MSLKQKFRMLCKSESGQSVILIAVVVLSFLLFFSFAINTGLLIAAKISVQSAADAAAYAGAATQARQLNAISYLNYDMRRQYKKFLFRYTFMGSLGNPQFPNPSAPSASGLYDFPKMDFTSSSKGAPFPLKVPAVCIPLVIGHNTSSDNCMHVNLPNTAAQIQAGLPSAMMNSLTQDLITSIKTIQDFQKTLCTGQGQINLFVLMAWLFRGDVDPTQLANFLDTILTAAPNGMLQPAEKAEALNTIKMLVTGLGLYPRNIISLMRIHTLEKILNTPPQSEVGLDRVVAWEKSTTADEYERTIQAYRSALVNLNESVLNPKDVTLEELQNPAQIALQDILIDFKAYVQMMKIDNSDSDLNTMCKAGFFGMPAYGAPVGVKRISSSSPVHYAVKIKAKANLMFLPTSDRTIDLEAVAGAKPFGSRIGPADVGLDLLTQMITPGSPNGNPICTSDCVSPTMELVGSNQFYTATFLNQLMTIATGGSGKVSLAGLIQAQEHAIAPNPIEIGRYNVLPAPKSFSEMQFEFIPYSSGAPSNPANPNPAVYRFYAPIMRGSDSDPTSFANGFIDSIFAKTQVGANDFGISMSTLNVALKHNIETYMGHLASATSTENGETATFAAVELPLSPGLTPAPFWLTQSSEVLSSWGPKYARVTPGAPPHYQARFGYSVKFVTLQSLLQQGMADQDGDLSKVSH